MSSEIRQKTDKEWATRQVAEAVAAFEAIFHPSKARTLRKSGEEYGTHNLFRSTSW